MSSLDKHPKTLLTEQQYHRRKVGESLEMKKAKTNKRRNVLNRNERNLVKTNTWTLTEKETKQRLDVKFRKRFQ